jgi:CRP-like cAMP-binding protein
MEVVPLRRRQVLHEPNLPIEYVYFIIDGGVVSLQARTKADGAVGVGLMDGAAVIGIPVILGTMRTFLRAVVEVPGTAYRISAHKLQETMESSPELRQALLSYVHARMVQEAQLVLCSARHSCEQRIARLLLHACDHLRSDRILITHQLLARDLGVRRATISSVMSEFEMQGTVRRGRACIEVVDRAALERTACECYRIITAVYRRLGASSPAKPGSTANEDAPPAMNADLVRPNSVENDERDPAIGRSAERDAL